MEAGMKASDINIIHNWFNEQRFLLREEIRETPERALIFSNYIDWGNHYQVILDACRSLNIQLDIAGESSGNPVDAPEKYCSNTIWFLERPRPESKPSPPVRH